MVHFENPWFEFVVQEDIEAQDLEAHGVLDVIRLA